MSPLISVIILLVLSVEVTGHRYLPKCRPNDFPFKCIWNSPSWPPLPLPLPGHQLPPFSPPLELAPSPQHNRLILTIPPTFCSRTKCHPGRENLHHFTVRGLWPANDSGVIIYKGNDTMSSTQFLREIGYRRGGEREVTTPLTGYWPALYVGYLTDQDLWRHEFNYHGRMQSVNHSPAHYLEEVLSIMSSIEITDALDRAGIRFEDGKAHKQEYIKVAIQQRFTRVMRRAEPDPNDDNSIYFTCSYNDRTPTTAYLKEIIICLTQTGISKITSCGQHPPSNSCGSNDVVIPATPFNIV